MTIFLLLHLMKVLDLKFWNNTAFERKQSHATLYFLQCLTYLFPRLCMIPFLALLLLHRLKQLLLPFLHHELLHFLYLYSFHGRESIDEEQEDEEDVGDEDTIAEDEDDTGEEQQE